VVVKGMTIITPSPMPKKHRRIEKEKEEEEEQEQRQAREEEEGEGGDDSFVVPDEMDISVTLPEEDEEPEIHYRGPRSSRKAPPAREERRVAELVTEAKQMEESGSAVCALDRYMDAFEAAERNSSVRQQLGQKILFLRKQLPAPAIVAAPCFDDDVELFDDDADVNGVASSLSKAVIDSPKQDASDSASCIICLSGPKEMCFVPCGHVCCCSTCAATPGMRTCPICRARITTRVKIFLS
jgi:hypothetical protein